MELGSFAGAGRWMIVCFLFLARLDSPARQSIGVRDTNGWSPCNFKVELESTSRRVGCELSVRVCGSDALLRCGAVLCCAVLC